MTAQQDSRGKVGYDSRAVKNPATAVTVRGHGRTNEESDVTDVTAPRRAMGSHQSHRAKTTTWLTPPHIIDALGPFDLDPCAAPGWVTARKHITLPDDGLVAEWHGHVWLNPPYGSECWQWLAKLADHGDGIALIFARTEPAGFVREVWGKATAVMFLHGRLHFHHPDGTRAPANAGAPSCLVAYGERGAVSLNRSGLDGTTLRTLGAPWQPSAARGSIATNGPMGHAVSAAGESVGAHAEHRKSTDGRPLRAVV